MRQKWIMAVMLMILVGCTSAYAAVEQTGNSSVIKITGNAGEANIPVAIEVYAGDADANSLEGLTREQYTDVLILHDQSLTDDEGNYSFEFNITDNKSGEYTAYLATETSELPDEIFYYTNIEDHRSLAIALNDAAKGEQSVTLEQATALIKTEYRKLGYDDDMLEDINLSQLTEVALNTFKEYPLNPEDREYSLNLMKKILFVQRLNQKKIDNLFDEGVLLTGLPNGDLADWYDKSYITDDLEKNVTERLCGKDIKSYQNYETSLTDAFILATVMKPNGTNNVKYIMKAFAQKIGISVSNVGDSVWRSLAGKNYSNLSALKTAFSSLLRPASATSSDSGSTRTNRTESISISTQETTSAAAIETFKDIESVVWAQEAINYLAGMKIISGYGSGKFLPNNNILREEFCKIVVGAFVSDAEETEIPFADVDTKAWYYSCVSKAYDEGIVAGIGDGRFGVGMPITRQDMCVILYNAAQKAGITFETEDEKEKFSDDADISGYAKTAVYALKGIGAVDGITETEFAPGGCATRAQAAKIIYFLIKEM